MRTYYHFRSEAEPALQAFTDDPTADKLPAENRPWILVVKLSPEDAWAYAVSKAAVAAGVLENGFLLWGAPKQPTSSKPIVESDRVEGTAVYDRAGNRIGTIRRLLIEKVSGRVTDAVMTFGGFLGIGSHEHTIPWDKLSYDTRLGGYKTDITQEQLRGAAPLYGDGEIWPDRKREKELRDHWDVPPRF
jgi:PRC-barrel domain protein